MTRESFNKQFTILQNPTIPEGFPTIVRLPDEAVKRLKSEEHPIHVRLNNADVIYEANGELADALFIIGIVKHFATIDPEHTGIFMNPNDSITFRSVL